MPVAFICETCKQTGTSLDGWFIISVQFCHNDPNAPNPPGSRMLDTTAPDLVFDKVECRQIWCEKAGISDPGIGPFEIGRMQRVGFPVPPRSE
jgi:hypothetical protein